MIPERGHHAARRAELRGEALTALACADGQEAAFVRVAATALITLLDYMDEQDDAAYDAWEHAMGEDL